MPETRASIPRAESLTSESRADQRSDSLTHTDLATERQSGLPPTLPRTSSRKQRIFVIGILIFALLAGAGLRTFSVAHKQTPSHNEAISYLAGTCNEGKWDTIVDKRLFPDGSWATAGDWQKLWKMGKPMCFSEISNGLLAKDIHPPLYFWVFHVWMLVFGVSLWSGAALNIVLSALTGLALFGLARRVLKSSISAAFAAFIWLVSPAVVSISTEARQYDLFTLVTVVFIWQVLRLSDSKRKVKVIDWLLLALTCAAGALTQFIFGLVVATGGLILALGLIWKRELPWTQIAKRFGVAVTALGIGYLALPLLHPGFADTIHTAQVRSGHFTQAEFSERISRVLATIADFFVGKGINLGSARFIVPIAAACTAVLWMVAWAVLRRRQKKALGSINQQGAVGNQVEAPGHSTAQPQSVTDTAAGARIALVTLLLGGATIWLYLTFATPRNAMGAPYMSWTWPFLALTIIVGVHLVRPPLRVPVMACIAAAFLFSGIASAIRVDNKVKKQANATHLIRTQDTLLIDTDRRGILPAMLWHADPSQRVFAMMQKDMLKDPELWQKRLGNDFLYVGGMMLGSTQEGRNKINKLLRADGYSPQQLGSIRLWYPRRIEGIAQPVVEWTKGS